MITFTMITARILLSLPFLSPSRKPLFNRIFKMKISGGVSISQIITLVFLVTLLIPQNDCFAIKGFDRFNYKPRKSQVSNISPQSMQLGRYQHPQGAEIVRASNFDCQYEIGRKIVLVCAATGNPLPNITWLKDGIEIYAHKWAIFSEWVYGDYRQTKSSKMEIHPATTMDRGQYECLAENRHGIDRRRFRTEYLD